MKDEEIISHALQTCDQLRQALQEIGDSITTARTPIDDGELDFTTIRGELTDMEYYLMHARFAEGALRDSFVDLVGLVRHLQQAYHNVYRAWQTAQSDQAQAIRRTLSTVDQQSLDTLRRVSELLAQSEGVERLNLRSEINVLLSKYQS